jgi:SMODS-associated and fused to various effectors sensor domain
MKSGNKPEAGKAGGRTPKQNPIGEAKPSATKSTRYYDPQTLKLLWGRGAGRCAMADCRVELFVTEDDYDPVCVIGEMGHIAASSNAGPRAHLELDMRARDSYDNLVLLCRNCHRKVDTLKLSYPRERLLEIKANHEAWVRTALPERGFTNLRWNVLRLQGDFPFDPTTISEALSPDQEASTLQIIVSAAREPWSSIQESLKTQIHTLIANGDAVASRVAVFPLAPVSGCVYTGYLLTNRLNVRGFQYHRDQATWVWPKNLEGLTMPAVAEPVGSMSASSELFFLFELSAPIDASEVMESTGKDRAVYRCSVSDRSTGWLKSKAQLDELARKAREMFEAAAIRFPTSPRWHIFYAGPAPGGVVVGQQLNPTMVPTVQLYEFQRPRHIPSITITPDDSSLTRWTVTNVSISGSRS